MHICFFLERKKIVASAPPPFYELFPAMEAIAARHGSMPGSMFEASNANQRHIFRFGSMVPPPPLPSF